MADEKETVKAVAPTDSDKYLNNVILKAMIDPKSGFYALMCSHDNGQNWVPEYTAHGKMYHQRDIKRIAEISFEHIKLKSPNGTAFYLSIDDDGTLKTTKVGDSQ